MYKSTDWEKPKEVINSFLKWSLLPSIATIVDPRPAHTILLKTTSTYNLQYLFHIYVSSCVAELSGFLQFAKYIEV